MAELQELGVSGLRKLAAEEGCDAEAIENARDSNAPKEELIALIEAKRAAAPAPAPIPHSIQVQPPPSAPPESGFVVRTLEVENDPGKNEDLGSHPMLKIPHLEDNEVDENKVITKHFLSSIDPLPSNTLPADRDRVLDEMYSRAKDFDSQCSRLVEDIKPADMMNEFLLAGEAEMLSLRVVSMDGGPTNMDQMVGSGSVGLTKADGFHRLHFVMQQDTGHFALQEGASASKVSSSQAVISGSGNLLGASSQSAMSAAVDNRAKVPLPCL